MPRRTIIITGTSSGIGKATADLLVKDYNIMGLARRTGNDISQSAILDVFEAENVYAIINNAAICIKKPFYECSILEWEQTINTNVRPIWLLAKKFLEQLKNNKGCIINISSVHSVATLKGNALYAMSKGAVDALTRAMALELAPFGIRVNCIRPGSVMTPMLRYEKEMEETIPLNKVAKAEEIAKVIKFLLSNDALYITGECINVDGGILARLSVLK